MHKFFLILVLTLGLSGCQLTPDYFSRLEREPTEVISNIEKMGYVITETTISKNDVVLFIRDCNVITRFGTTCLTVFNLPIELYDSVILVMERDIVLAREQYSAVSEKK